MYYLVPKGVDPAFAAARPTAPEAPQKGQAGATVIMKRAATNCAFRAVLAQRGEAFNLTPQLSECLLAGFKRATFRDSGEGHG